MTGYNQCRKQHDITWSNLDWNYFVILHISSKQKYSRNTKTEGDNRFCEIYFKVVVTMASHVRFQRVVIDDRGGCIEIVNAIMGFHSYK